MNQHVSGQATLPALENELGYGAITHLKPQAEAFCWEYVLAGSSAKQAYLKAYPGSGETSALANASRLLKTEKVQQRITEIRAELQRRYAVDAQSIVRLLTMSMGVPRSQFVDSDGKPLDIHLLPPEAAAITDIQIVLDRNGNKKALPQVPERMKAAIELAKILGLTKERLELSGPNGASLRSGASINIYIPENGRDTQANPDLERIDKLKETPSYKKLRLEDQIKQIHKMSEKHGTEDTATLLEKLEIELASLLPGGP